MDLSGFFLALALILATLTASIYAKVLVEPESLQLSNVSGMSELLVASDSRIKRQAATNSAGSRFKKMLRLLEAGKLQDCAGRVVCDLNCAPDVFGTDGARVLATLQRLQTSGHFTRHDMDFYVHAGVLGRRGKGAKASVCHELCRKSYPVCPAESQDLISVASLIRLRV